MSGLYLSRGLFPQEFLRPTVDFILACSSPAVRSPGSKAATPIPGTTWRRPWACRSAASGRPRAAYEWLYHAVG